jgi:hypothetical protein
MRIKWGTGQQFTSRLSLEMAVVEVVLDLMYGKFEWTL